jgi:hypothetical protein
MSSSRLIGMQDAEGDLKPGETREVLGPIVAERRARVLAFEHAGAVAFCRTGKPTTGELQDEVSLRGSARSISNLSADDRAASH